MDRMTILMKNFGHMIPSVVNKIHNAKVKEHKKIQSLGRWISKKRIHVHK